MAKVKNVGDTVIVMGEALPAPRLQIIDGEGAILPATAVTVEFIMAMGGSTTLDGTLNDDTWEFTWETETEAPGSLRSLVRVTADPAIPAMYGPTYIVYDPAELWVSPSDVLAIAGDGYTESQAVLAILYAQTLVRAWVSTPVQSPVPVAIREATLLLAARVLTSSAASPSQGAGGFIVSESIADYTVRYANPLNAGDGAGLATLLGPEVLALLSPYHGSAYSVITGPANPLNPLPVSALYGESWWWGDAVLYDEEYQP